LCTWVFIDVGAHQKTHLFKFFFLLLIKKKGAKKESFRILQQKAFASADFMMGFVVSSCFEEKLLPDSPPKRFVFTNFLIGFSSCCVECFHLQIC
jgi:hypothetical protein